MKIVVCGCSFSSRSSKKPGTHWSELLEEKIGNKILNLATPGTSNGHIRLQLEEALKVEPDWIIFNSTTRPRIELKKKPSALSRYRFFDFDTTKHNDRVMVSFPLNGLSQGKIRDGDLTIDQHHAIEQYALYLYDDAWKRQMDQWIINSGLWCLHEHGIRVSYDPWLLDKGVNRDDPVVADSMPGWFRDRYYKRYEDSYSYLMKDHLLDPKEDPGYHLNPSAQIILADYYERLIDKSGK